MAQKVGRSAPLQGALEKLGLVAGAGVLFLVICLCSAATVQPTVVMLIVLTLSAAFLFWERLRSRLKPPMLALALVVLMDGASSLYTVSGKFALYDLLKVLAAFCLALLLLTLVREEKPERRVAELLEGCAAVAGLVSIDLLSTRWISTPVLTILGWFTTDYTNLEVVEEGVRMTSVFLYPNAFAACMGIGVLLGLGLALSAEKPGARALHLVCLSVNSLAFVLSFSLGATAMIIPAFLALLALTGREGRTGLLILMVETLAVTMAAAFPISVTSMTAWTGVQPIPLLCTAAGAAALCGLDVLAGRRIEEKLRGHGKAVLCLMAALLACVALFVAAACTLTTGVTLQKGESLRRSAYPEPGAYTLEAEVDGDPIVTIESQNRADAMMHTSSVLYRGPLSQAEFTVPEGSMVVWFQFDAEEETRLDGVTYSGESGSGRVPLGYRLLPGFIANRLQGLRANQNAIQRLVFFEDGMKLFRRSPIVGLGLGAYASGINSVQSFFYYTKYAHNHYIQVLTETGIVGLALFLGLMAASALAVWQGRKRPLAPAMGAALVFMVGHGAVDTAFSQYAFLPMSFGVFAVISLGCGDVLPVPGWAGKKGVSDGLALGVCAILVVFGVLLGCNIAARNMVDSSPDLATLEQAAALAPYERADYMLSYVVQVTGASPEDEIRRKADRYAARLAKLDSNVIPYYLAEYYLDLGQTEKGLEQAERYVDYVSSDQAVWEKTFALLEEYEQDAPEYRAGVAHIAELLDAWNAENMGHIVLSEQTQAFIARMRA